MMAVAFSALLAVSCKKDDIINPGGGGGGNTGGGGGTGNSAGKVTAVGTSAGTAESKVIGVGGGSFTSADGRITIDFPAGALNDNQTIGIEPISNHVSGAAGLAYRITPHNLNFNLPVKVSFNYGDSDIVGTIKSGLAIAYQDANRVWQAVGGGTNDTSARKIAVFTTHFSDWALFKKYTLVPEMAFVATGATLKMGVVRTIDLTGDFEVPPLGGPVKDSLAAVVKEWKLAGAGTLAPNGSEAMYTAPAQIPANNPQAVSVTLNSTGTWKIILVTNIYVGGEGITMRIDNGPWMQGQVPLGVRTVSGITQMIGAPVVNGVPLGAIAIRWTSAPILTHINWALQMPEFNYSPGNNQSYWHFYVVGQNVIPSPGGLFLFRRQSSGGYVSGTFILEKSGRSEGTATGQVWSTHRIEGFFHVKVS